MNPNGAATTAWFEWGTSPTLATFSSTASQSLGSGTTSQAVTAALSGLTSGTTYYFRVAASNSAGTVEGIDRQFQHHGGGTGRVPGGWHRPGFHGSRTLSGQCPVGNYAWMPVTNSGYSGSGALQILPNDGANPAIAGAGPRLDYQVQFTKTGTHYIWIRALSNSLAFRLLVRGIGRCNGRGVGHERSDRGWGNLDVDQPEAVGRRSDGQRHLPGCAHGQCMDAGIRHRAGQAGAEHQRELRPHRQGPGGECKHGGGSDGDDERGHLRDVRGRHVNGGVNPNGAATTAWFEWGTSPTLATFSSTSTQSLGSGTTSQAVDARRCRG